MRWLALGGLIAPLVGLGTIGVFSRYAADDYCTAAQVHLGGFVEAQSRLYTGWSGRFAATLLITTVEQLSGAPAVAWLPALTLLAWLAIGAWTVGQLGASAGQPISPLAALTVAALLAFATLQTTADVRQILFWQTGLVTYLWPLLIATGHVGWLARLARPREVHSWTGVAVSSGLAFVAGGTSETFAAAQVTALGCGLVLALAARRGRLAAMLLTGMGGAILALAILALSPGNAVRQETAEQMPVALAVPQALEFTLGWLRLTFARPHAVTVLFVLALPAALAAGHAVSPASVPARTARRWASLGAGLVVTMLVILAAMLPAFYALSSNPPARAQVIPEYVLICSLAVLGWRLGYLARAHLTRLLNNDHAARAWVVLAIELVLLAFGPLAMAGDVVQSLAPVRAYAAAWDQLDRDVRTERAQGVLDVTVRALPATGLVQNLEFVGPNRADWLNDCVARYYDLNTIASTLSLP